MFEVLVESGARQRPPLGPRLVSLSVHGSLLVVAAVTMQSGTRPAAPKPVAYPIEIFSSPARTSGAVEETWAQSPTVVPGPTMDVPSTVPPNLPPELPSPSTWTGPTAREMAGGEPPGRIGLGGGELGLSGVRLAGEVDEPVEILVPARPVYPPLLATAGIEGEVRIEFVVDTAGVCEPASVRVVSSTNPGFEASARDAVCKASYRAGRVRGQAVRQLVQQKIAFRQGR